MVLVTRVLAVFDHLGLGRLYVEQQKRPGGSDTAARFDSGAVEVRVGLGVLLQYDRCSGKSSQSQRPVAALRRHLGGNSKDGRSFERLPRVADRPGRRITAASTYIISLKSCTAGSKSFYHQSDHKNNEFADSSSSDELCIPRFLGERPPRT